MALAHTRVETVGMCSIPRNLLPAQEGADHLGQLVLHNEQVAGHGCRRHEGGENRTECKQRKTISHNLLYTEIGTEESQDSVLPPMF